MNDKKIPETKKTEEAKKVSEPKYPKWEGAEKAEIGKKYQLANGNIIQKGKLANG
jgi:hypothetical protein